MTQLSLSARYTVRLRLVASVTLVLVGSLRCQSVLDPQPLQRFETCEDLQLFLEDQILHPGVEPSFESGGVFVGCAGNEALSDGPGEGEGEGARAFTTTNTQETDVDEPDYVKNNGDLIFVLRRGQMKILQAWPADQMQVLSTTEIAGTPFTMLFDDDNDRALVIASFVSDKQHVLAKLYDVSDPTAPVELRTTLIDGNFVDARAVAGEVMLVTQAQLNVGGAIDTAPFSDDANRLRLRQAGLGRLLPKVSDFIVGQDAAPRVDTATACENTYAPSRTDGRSILLVHGLSLVDETQPLRSTGVVAGFSHVYGSPSSLYLASTERSDGGYFTPSFATTRIHKLAAFAGAGAAEYVATGVVMGVIKDELSLDEDAEGLLRVVVTDDSASTSASAQTNALLVLEANGTELTEIARVDDIGRGENVESVRMLGDKAYVVTYPVDEGFVVDENGLPRVPFTDPLFVVDLADGRNPVLRGELEVDGYSAYIHPLDATHLLTVGVNTNPETNALLGLSLLLFDVADADRPSLLHRYDFGDEDTGSEALVDRHAFTYFASQRMLAIPVQRFAGDAALASSALAVFEVDVDEGFTALGEIEQAQLYVDFDADSVRFGGCAAVRRSVMISDDEGAFVYAVSTAGVTAAALEPGLPTTAVVQLGSPGDQACDFSGSPL